jgi:hypothetical protein
LKELFGRARSIEQMHGASDDSGPSGLAVGTEPGAIFAAKILVENDRVAPVPVLLELRDATRVSAINALVTRALLNNLPRDDCAAMNWHRLLRTLKDPK